MDLSEIHVCHLRYNSKANLIFVVVLDVDLSDMKTNEPYDYKFVKWMTKNKVMFIGLCIIVLYFKLDL